MKATISFSIISLSSTLYIKGCLGSVYVSQHKYPQPFLRSKKSLNHFRDNLNKVVSEFKKNSEKNILIFGSANLSKTLIKDGLIDLYRIMVNPVVLGKGYPLFADSENKMDLKLINTKSFKSGNVLMEYKQK